MLTRYKERICKDLRKRIGGLRFREIFGGFWGFVGGFLFCFGWFVPCLWFLGAFVDLCSFVTVWLFARLRACVRFL